MMKNRDYPKLEQQNRILQQQYEDAKAFMNIICHGWDENPRRWHWRMSPAAQSHSWDFYLDEIDFG